MKRVGIVGCGNISAIHAKSLCQMSEIEIVAAADIVLEKAKKFAKEFTNNHAAVFEQYDEMFEKVSLDVIHICTPHNLHVPIAIAALKKGIHVFSEKPPAISMKEFNELKVIASQQNAKIGFCFQNRYNETTKKIDDLVQKGMLGEVIGARAFVTWRRDEDYYYNSWQGKMKDSGGGALMNQAIHTLDLLLRYFEEPVTVKASINNHHLQNIIEVEDTVEVWLTFKGGKRACFYASTAYATDAPVILEYQFERGSATIIDKTIIIKEATKEPTSFVCKEKKGCGKIYWGNGHLKCIQDFYKKLDADDSYQNDIHGVENTMKTMMKIYDFR